MLHHRIKASPWTLLISSLSLLLLYSFFTIVQPVGSALGAALLQSATDAVTVPPYLNYQGTLRDAEGKPISGVHKLTFRIYGDVTAPLPEALWMEEHTDVTVRDGHFSVLLGDSKPISPTVFQSGDRFIGIMLDGLDEMVPRQRFASQPYAFQAHNADLLDGLQAAAFALAGHVHNFLSAPDGDPVQAVFVTNEGNVGVGTNAPDLKLHVDGNGVRVKSNNRALDLRTDLGAVDVMAPDTDLYIGSYGGNKNVIINHMGGRVGILTPYPREDMALDVNGNMHVQNVLRMGPYYLPPVFMRRYGALGADSITPIEGISASHYDCTVGGWMVNMDVDENDKGPYGFWTYIEGDTWMLRARFWTDKPEESKADVICYLRDSMVQYDGDRYDFGYP